MKKEELLKIIEQCKSIPAETVINWEEIKNKLNWFYPLLTNLSTKNINGEFILHPKMQEAYKYVADFSDDPYCLKKLPEAPTGMGKSGLICYSCIKWFEKNKENTNCIYHLINPLNVLNDQTTQELIFVIINYIQTNKLNVDDFIIYLNRCDGDHAGNNYFNEIYPIESGLPVAERKLNIVPFNKYSYYPRKKYELVVSCVPSVFKIAGKWNKDVCYTAVDEIHNIHTTNKEINDDDEKERKIDWPVWIKTVNDSTKYLCGITATVTEELLDDVFNSYKTKQGKSDYLKNTFIIPFSAGLEAGRTVMPYVTYTAYKNTFSMKKIFEEHHLINERAALGNIYQKILITCYNNEEIANTCFKMDYNGIVYISTCYFGKCKLLIKDGQITVLKTNMSVNEFSNDLNDEKSDCLVFHIKQLIAGINITGLTGCILPYIESCNNFINTKQTIGRTLRKTGFKTGAIVTFLIEDLDGTEESLMNDIDNIKSLMIKMYGCGNWSWAKAKGKHGKNSSGNPKELLPASHSSELDISVSYPTWFLNLEGRIKLRIGSMQVAKKVGNKLIAENIKATIKTLIDSYVSKMSFSPGHEINDKELIQSQLILDCGNWETL